MPQTRAYLAVPFEGKDVPSRSSEFAHPDIVLGLTVLAYRYEGLRYTDFDQIVAQMRSRLEKDVGPYHLRKETIRHEAWVREAGGCIRRRAAKGKEAELVETTPEEKQQVPLRLLRRSNSEQMQKLFKLLQFEPMIIHYYRMPHAHLHASTYTCTRNRARVHTRNTCIVVGQ